MSTMSYASIWNETLQKYKNPTILIVIHSIHGFQKQLYLK